ATAAASGAARASRTPPAARPDLTRAGVCLGTPLYMAPEVWQGEPATARADVYAFGVLLFYLAAGRTPFDATNLPQLMAAVCMSETPALAAAAPGVEPAFAAVVDRCLRRDPAARFASGEELREALEQLTPEARAGAIPKGNPYRGLHAFEAEHRALFFGRGAEVRAIVERLRHEPFVLVAGDSGVGKSSLCRAGVLPSLLEGALGEERSWSLITLVPGRRPTLAFGAALAPLLDADEEALARSVTDDPPALVRTLRQKLGDRRGVVLFVDQAEELVTLADAREAAVIAETLGHCAVGRAGLRLLATVRGDFLTRLAALPGLGDEVMRAFHLLRPLSADGIREAVAGPARAKGTSFESEALVDELVAAGAEGGLPLLQFALAELWDKRDVGGAVIPASALAAIGGVAGALARHADGVIAGLAPAQREAPRRVLLRLVTADGTRVRRAATELDDADPDVRPVLDALVRGRLVVAREGEEGAVYEIAHEALIEGWPTLRRWLDADAGTRAVRERLGAAAAEWERLGRRRDALWGPRQLAEVAALPVAELPPREAAFLVAARGAVRWRWVVRIVALATVPVLALLVWGGVRLKVRADLDHRVRGYLTDGRALLERARATAAAAEAQRRAAFARFDAREVDAAEGVWAQALARGVEAERAYARASQPLEAALMLDQTRAAARALLADLLYERALLAERDRRDTQRDELLERLRLFDARGERERRWNAPARLAVETRPPGAVVTIERFVAKGGRRQLVPERELGGAPVADTVLPPGSYVVTAAAPGRATVRYPVLLRRDARLRLAVDLPTAGAVPAGFVYVPAGPFLFGSAGDERVRRTFLNAVPAHEVRTAAFLIARTETTYAEWLDYLRALPPAERARRTPRATVGQHGSLDLKELAGGIWQITMRPGSRTYTARQGESLVYAERKQRQRQDWLRFPVTGISWEDFLDYAAWLGRSGRVPGARACTELEWERAARGADDREYPHGDVIEPDDANTDATYGKNPLGLGPDEVGAHPASRSPFGLDDMAGNVWEYVASSLAKGEVVVRGGAYYFGDLTNAATNRESAQPAARDLTGGLRVCATWPAPAR
ncbi:MAG: SUMF1/EgtB/PvdO family nonheme iron enzyme, partial [Deltaproteobacteria bacterium]|nr:SUMF1/EgtB/PvdO family nonheme iron enzyme [Deltaproteobacteria bacterium]